MKLTKTIVTGSVLALAFLANCDLIMGPSWSYGEAEMRSAVEGTWKMTRNGESITLVAKQATSTERSERATGFVKSAAACGSRSFVRSASACVDSTRMPLEITAAGHEIRNAAFEVMSTSFKSGELRFTLDGNSVQATLDPSGAVAEVAMFVPDKGTHPITLQRIAK